MSKRILTWAGVIQRENLTSAPGSSTTIPASSCSSRRPATRCAASPSPSPVSTAPPGNTQTPAARFMAGVWVFPGGAVDTGEGEGDAAHRVAGLRELHEEAGIVVDDPGALVKFSRWITPAQVRIRFDTHFFLAAAPDGQEPTIDGSEIVDSGWFAPADALVAHARDELALVFPTIKHLEQLCAFATADEAIAHARASHVSPVEPRVVTEGEMARIVLPGEPGYDA